MGNIEEAMLGMEDKIRCDYCSIKYPKEEMTNYHELDICDSCYEGAIA